MPHCPSLRRTIVFTSLFFALSTAPARAQVTEVFVGITPSCPYGIGACWAGAYESLNRLDGVTSVVVTPDGYNCTAQIFLKSRGLPDVDALTSRFKSLVGESYKLRGFEVTIEGTIEGQGEQLAVRIPGVYHSVRLTTLRNKLQWNFKKAAPREPEPAERDALKELFLKIKDAKTASEKFQITGPLKKDGDDYVLEVRQFIPMKLEKDPYGRK
jgi:galactose oxidase